MKEFALRVAVAVIRAAAGFVKLFVKRGKGIVLISCQDDFPTRDILDLAEAIRQRPGAPLLSVTAGRMERSIGGAFAFAGKMFSLLKEIAAARIVVIDSYCPAVSIPKKRPGQKVVQIWHAPEAIKKFSLQILDTNAGYKSRTAMILDMHQGYDYILCPSEATRPFFAEAFGYPENVFVKYGLPSLDRVGLMKRPSGGAGESPERAAARAAIYEKYPTLADYAYAKGGTGRGAADLEAGEKPLTFVYAPTFRDGTAADAEGLIRAFARAARISGISVAFILKPHPLEAANLPKGGPADGRRRLPADGAKTGAQGDSGDERFCVIADAEFALIDWYAAADAVITDYSGAAVETAAAGVASYYYVYDMDDYAARRGLNVDLRTEAVGKYAFADADLLAAQAVCDFSAGTAEIYDYGALAAFAEKYLEVPLEGNTDRLADFIAGL